jgi:hypothetical protein
VTTSDVWSDPHASLAALSVFRLAEEEPSIRPSDREATGKAAVALGEWTGKVPRPVVEELIADLPDADVDLLVSFAEELAPERWRMLVAAAGPTPAREPLLLGAVTVAVLEQQPPRQWLVQTREATADYAPGPLNVLASLLHATSVWSAREISAAGVFAPPELHPAERTSALFAFADGALTPAHRARARLIAGPVGRILPVNDAPRTTRDLESALEAVVSDDGADELCGLLLLTRVLQAEGLVPTAPSLN